jgi:hypothetical protein
MSVSAQLEELMSLGVELWIEAGRLRYKAPAGTVASSFVDFLSANKVEIMAILTQRKARGSLLTFRATYNDRLRRYRALELKLDSSEHPESMYEALRPEMNVLGGEFSEILNRLGKENYTESDALSGFKFPGVPESFFFAS